MLDLTERDTAVAAGTQVAARLIGASGASGRVLGDGHHVVLRVDPGPVVAKVGTDATAAAVLGFEADVCTHLHASGAPAGTPIGGLVLDTDSGLPVTLWEWIRPAADPRFDAVDVAQALVAVHGALATWAGPVPSCAVEVRRAAEALTGPVVTARLGLEDRSLLGRVLAEIGAEVLDDETGWQVLHGDPHAGNIVSSPDGPVFVDFEAVCRGPLEWDLASLEPAVARAVNGVDERRLERCRLLTSARVAVWCAAGEDRPFLRRHAAHHLAVLRRARR